MSRRSLRPQLNQIRGWVRQGRTDAWITHQLEVTVQQIQAFKREHGLEPDGDATPDATGEEVDLRAEDDAQIAAELEAEEARRAEEEAKARKDATGRMMFEKGDWAGSDADSDDEDDSNEWNLDHAPRDGARAAEEGGRAIGGQDGHFHLGAPHHGRHR